MNCRACNSDKLTEFLDLGKQYLSDFREDDSRPPKYPLVAVFCENCKLVQLKDSTPPGEMYHERYGFKSDVSEVIKADLDDVVMHAFQYNNDPVNWLDIGSNDGTLLSYVGFDDVYKVGVDPVKFLCDEAKQHADRIINNYFVPRVAKELGFFDVITTVSCFYDMPDPSEFVESVKNILNDKGVWIIQQNYLLTTMELGAVDSFCHEHLEYYTLLSLENLLNRFGLEVNEVKLSTINGGSIRTVVSHKGTFEIDESVEKQRELESMAGLDDIWVYKVFAETTAIEINKLRNLVIDLDAQGKTIAILAASTRGSTIWQTAGIEKYIQCAVERNPAKVGKYFSAIGVPIISEKKWRKKPTDYAIIGPWFFADAIIAREQDYVLNGGKLILPLPKVEVIDVEYLLPDLRTV